MMNSMESKGRRGQVLLLATASLFLLFAVVALAVDLGWAYFKKQQAQSAADAAAMGAVVYALNHGYTCGTNGVVCGSTYNCASPNVTPPTTDFQNGCLYAELNGFKNTGNQAVNLTGDNSAPP